MKPVTSMYALTNTASGVAGEAAVTAALLRAGLQVAKPYWNDDEMDLLVFGKSGDDFIPIPIQVKSVQCRNEIEDEVCTQGLRKMYVERQPALCLAIFSPAQNKIWFFAGPDKIKQVHAEGVLSSCGKRTKYEDIPVVKETEPKKKYGMVPIYVNVSEKGDIAFDKQWLIDTKSPKKLREQISELATRIMLNQTATVLMSSVLTVSAEESEPQEDDDVEMGAAEDAEVLLKKMK